MMPKDQLAEMMKRLWAAVLAPLANQEPLPKTAAEARAYAARRNAQARVRTEPPQLRILGAGRPGVDTRAIYARRRAAGSAARNEAAGAAGETTCPSCGVALDVRHTLEAPSETTSSRIRQGSARNDAAAGGTTCPSCGAALTLRHTLDGVAMESASSSSARASRGRGPTFAEIAQRVYGNAAGRE